jgi:hypothetical protein
MEVAWWRESDRTGAGNLITAKRLEHTGYMGRLAIHYCTRATTTLEGVWAVAYTHKFKALRTHTTPSRSAPS